MTGYTLVLSEDAARIFAAADRSDQRRLGVAIDDLKRTGFQPSRVRERVRDGRLHELLFVRGWTFTIWLDHAAREIRIVRLIPPGS